MSLATASSSSWHPAGTRESLDRCRQRGAAGSGRASAGSEDRSGTPCAADRHSRARPCRRSGATRDRAVAERSRRSRPAMKLAWSMLTHNPSTRICVASPTVSRTGAPSARLRTAPSTRWRCSHDQHLPPDPPRQSCPRRAHPGRGHRKHPRRDRGTEPSRHGRRTPRPDWRTVPSKVGRPRCRKGWIRWTSQAMICDAIDGDTTDLPSTTFA